MKKKKIKRVILEPQSTDGSTLVTKDGSLRAVKLN